MNGANEENAEKALHYLLSSSDDHAQATAESRQLYQAIKETLPDLLRETEAEGYLKAEGSEQKRKSEARTTEDYKEVVKKRQEVLDQYREAEYRRQRLENGREAARLTLSCWQTSVRNTPQV